VKLSRQLPLPTSNLTTTSSSTIYHHHSTTYPTTYHLRPFSLSTVTLAFFTEPDTLFAGFEKVIMSEGKHHSLHILHHHHHLSSTY